jgi:hypothetical protein
MLSFAIHIHEAKEKSPEPEDPLNEGCQYEGRHQCYVDHLRGRLARRPTAPTTLFHARRQQTTDLVVEVQNPPNQP